MWRNQPGETFVFNRHLFGGSASAPEGKNVLNASDNPFYHDKNEKMRPKTEETIRREETFSPT